MCDNKLNIDLSYCEKCITENTLMCELGDDYCEIFNKLYKLDKDRFNKTCLKNYCLIKEERIKDKDGTR